MNPTRGYRLMVLALLGSCLFSLPSLAVDASKGSARDNSGRRIASVVPRSHSTGGHSVDSPGGPSGKSNALHERLLSGLASAPDALPPEMKGALSKGSEAAKGLSKIAGQRIGNLSVWVTTLWRELNDFPLATPVSPMAAPEPPHHLMRPLVEPERKPSELWYTNESRMKTIVTR